MSLLGCFPHNERYRTYAKLSEGGAILAGIGMELLVNTGADCDASGMGLGQDSSCHTRANVFGDIGLGLILAGVLGFVATISTAEDAKPEPPRIEIKAKPEPPPPVKLPDSTQPPAPATGSAAPTTP